MTRSGTIGRRGWLGTKPWLARQWIVVGLFFLGLLLYFVWGSDRGELGVRDTAMARQGEQVVVSGILVNRGDRTLSRLAIEVAFFDPDHRRIGRTSAAVPKLEPRSEMRFSTESVPLEAAAHYQVTLPALANPYGN